MIGPLSFNRSSHTLTCDKPSNELRGPFSFIRSSLILTCDTHIQNTCLHSAHITIRTFTKMYSHKYVLLLSSVNIRTIDVPRVWLLLNHIYVQRLTIIESHICATFDYYRITYLCNVWLLLNHISVQRLTIIESHIYATFDYYWITYLCNVWLLLNHIFVQRLTITESHIFATLTSSS